MSNRAEDINGKADESMALSGHKGTRLNKANHVTYQLRFIAEVENRIETAERSML